jgi:hypothetical protein
MLPTWGGSVKRTRTLALALVIMSMGLASMSIAPASAQTTEQYQAFVERSYGHLLNRSPESPAFETWVSELEAGLPRTEYAFALLRSDEFRAFIVSVFYGYLERAPDPDALAAFVPLIDGGSSWEYVQSLVLGSEEFFANVGSDNEAFIGALYGVALNRSPDPQGSDFFLQKLEEGWSRQMVAEAVVLSPEARTLLIGGIYMGLLGREVDQPSLDVWVVTPYESVAVGVVASDEYFDLPPPT